MAKHTPQSLVEEEAIVRATDIMPATAIASFNAEELKVYEELKKIVDKKTIDDLWWFWDLGKKLITLREQAKTDRKIYGNHFMERLATALLGHKSPNRLYNAVCVAEAFPGRVSFNKFCKLHGDFDNHLNWTHITHLATVGNNAARLELATEALTKAWSPRELHEEIRKRFPTGRKGIGPPTTVPKSVPAGLSQITGSAETFMRRVKHAWMCDKFDMFDKADQIAPDKLSDALLSRVSATLARLQAMQNESQKLQKRLEQTETLIKRKLTTA